jgi:hypothetical protein
MRWLSKYFRWSWYPEYERLLGEYAELANSRGALLASLHGADFRPGANMDTELAKRFAELDKDYRALEKECGELRAKALIADRVIELIRWTRDL